MPEEGAERKVDDVPRKAKTQGKLKLKTHKATAKRFRLTAGGKLVRTKGGKSHLRRRTSARTKRLFARMIPVSGKKLVRKIRRLAPYMDRHEIKP